MKWMIMEKDTWSINGYIGAVVITVLLFVAFLNVFHQQLIIAVISFILAIILISGLTVVQPNEIIVVTFLGQYIGTIRKPGWIMTIPLSSKRRLSRKIHSFETDCLTSKTKAGEQLQLSAVIIYQIVDAAKAIYEVDAYRDFLKVEANTMMKEKSMILNKEEQLGSINEQNKELKHALNERLQFAGINIVDVRFTISYKQEDRKEHPHD